MMQQKRRKETHLDGILWMKLLQALSFSLLAPLPEVSFALVDGKSKEIVMSFYQSAS